MKKPKVIKITKLLKSKRKSDKRLLIRGLLWTVVCFIFFFLYYGVQGGFIVLVLAGLVLTVVNIFKHFRKHKSTNTQYYDIQNPRILVEFILLTILLLLFTPAKDYWIGLFAVCAILVILILRLLKPKMKRPRRITTIIRF